MPELCLKYWKLYLELVKKAEGRFLLRIFLNLAANAAKIRSGDSERAPLPAAPLLVPADNIQRRPAVADLRFAERPAVVEVGENKRYHCQGFSQAHVLHQRKKTQFEKGSTELMREVVYRDPTWTKINVYRVGRATDLVWYGQGRSDTDPNLHFHTVQFPPKNLSPYNEFRWEKVKKDSWYARSKNIFLRQQQNKDKYLFIVNI